MRQKIVLVFLLGALEGCHFSGPWHVSVCVLALAALLPKASKPEVVWDLSEEVINI